MVKVIKKLRRPLIRPTVQKDYSLPTEFTVPSDSLSDYSFLIYGKKKIGKSSLCSRFPSALFFVFEPGTGSLKLKKVPKDQSCFSDWSDVLGFLQAMKKHNLYRTAIFDPGNKAFDLCLSHVVSNQLGGVHPGQVKDYGASWRKVADAFQDVHHKIANLNMGFITLAHEKFSDFEGDDGKDYVRVGPKLSGSCNDFYDSIIDIVAYYHYVGKERWLQIRGDEFTMAGCGLESKFLTPRGSDIWSEIEKLDPLKDNAKILQLSEELGPERIIQIPMGNNPNTSYTNLINAFHNRQTETYRDMDDREKGGQLAKKKLKKFILKKSK